MERLHSRYTTLTAADKDENAQPTHFAAPSRGAAVATEGSCRSDQRSQDKLHLDQATATDSHATLLRTTPNGTEGMRRKTSIEAEKVPQRTASTRPLNSQAQPAGVVVNWSAADGVEATAPYIVRSALSGLSVSRQLRARHVAVAHQSLTPLSFAISSALVTSMSMGVTIDFVGAASGGGETTT